MIPEDEVLRLARCVEASTDDTAYWILRGTARRSGAPTIDLWVHNPGGLVCVTGLAVSFGYRMAANERGVIVRSVVAPTPDRLDDPVRTLVGDVLWIAAGALWRADKPGTPIRDAQLRDRFADHVREL